MEEKLEIIRDDDLKELAKKTFNFLDVKDITREEYNKRIVLFFDFIKDKKINHNTFREFKEYLSNRTDLTTSTKNKYLSTARIFLKELHRLGNIPFDITLNVKSFRQDKKHKRTGLNEEEVKMVCDYLQKRQDKEGIREGAIISLLLFQGLRQVEVIRLNVEDLNLNEGLAYIQGKGKDDKEPVYLHYETIKIIQKYLLIYGKKSGALFTSESNNSRNKRITTRAIRLIVKNILKNLNINRTTHGFRHFFTTKLLKAFKGDIIKVASFTRHKSLEMLQVYNDNLNFEKELPVYYGAFESIF